MKRRAILFLACGLLLPGLRAAAVTPPTEALFQGAAITVAAGGGTLRQRAVQACRQYEQAGPGAVFFAAWAFPASGRIGSCFRDRQSAGGAPLAIRFRDGRIRVGADRGLNVAEGTGGPAAQDAWGVSLLLYEIRNGRARLGDIQPLAVDRKYDLAGERLVWLGAADESQALDFIAGLRAQAADRDLGRELVFAVYLLKGQAAVAELIALARRDPSPEIRKQAIFWLGQRASAAAVAALGEVIVSPEVLEIKKAAVFALSQLPEEKGTPMLLNIARQNPQPRLRKEAIFWLGQSGDPRALEFFEEILLK